jgi:hypothetical protein
MKGEQGPCYKKFDPGIMQKKQPPRGHYKRKYIYTSVRVLWITAVLGENAECTGHEMMV